MNPGSDFIAVDATGGYGAGVEDMLKQMGMSVNPVNFASKASDERYFNKRSEMWYEMAEWVKRGGSIPKDPTLVKELTAPHYYIQNGKFRLEEKDIIKKRLGFSPDIADALALTFFMPETPRDSSMLEMMGVKEDRKKQDWNALGGR
jgi:hypothetical protein